VAENVMCEKKFFFVHWSHMCGINEPLPWDLRTTSENHVVFRRNTADSSAIQRILPKRYFNTL